MTPFHLPEHVMTGKEKALYILNDLRENANTIERELNADAYNAPKAQYHLGVIKSRSASLEHLLEYAAYEPNAE